jgi:transposase
MDHLAIDLGGRESQICVRGADGTILEEKRVATATLERFFASREKSVVVMETCAEAFRLADAARTAGHHVRVVPATLVKQLGVGARRTKTDQRDARALSEVSTRIDLPSVHIPSTPSREMKSRCGIREAQVRARTMLVNAVRGWMRGQGIHVRGHAEHLPAALRKYYATKKATQMPDFIANMLTTIDHLSETIHEADRDLATRAESDETCKRLMTVPGVGPVTSLRFVAALDDVTRFKSAHDVSAYLGLTPGEHSSSERKQRTSITKAGSPQVRWALTQAAWAARNSRGEHPMLAWALEVEKRRGKRVATIALARKLAGILFAMWRDGTSYDPRKGAAPPSTI